MENRANASAGQITTPVIDGLVKPNHLESSKQGNEYGLQMMAEDSEEEQEGGIEQEVSAGERQAIP